ncbi:MAG: hypothetical protein U0354_04960 [Candidatus Sericytochromatia bacterium]
MTSIDKNLNIYSQLTIDRKEHKANNTLMPIVDLKAPSILFDSLSLNKSGKANTTQNIFGDNKTQNVLNTDIKGKVMGVAKGTGYYPHNSKLEGGYHDKKGKKLNTLQDFLDGKASYVSVALDKNLYKTGVIKYGDKFRIPELEAKYGRKIEFRAVDTGGAFTNKKFSRIDICTGSKSDSLNKVVNGKLTLIKTD